MICQKYYSGVFGMGEQGDREIDLQNLWSAQHTTIQLILCLLWAELCVPLTNLYVEALIPDVTVFGARAFRS